jgi:aminoglycoside phosphotransferase (APT) family kinase protein
MDDLVPLDRLVPCLSAIVPGMRPGAVSVTKFASGQSNPTFRLDTPEGAFVLRRKPPGTLLKSAHAVEREYRVQKALEGSAVPVPRMLHLCEDDSVIGAPFYVMELVEGDNHDDPRLPGLTPDARTRLIGEMNRVLAELHSVDVAAVGLSEYGKPGNYYARQLSRWSQQYRASETGSLPDMDRLIAMLEERLPPDDGQVTLVHGDYRLDNLIFQGSRCAAVLDWELSTLGHPFADLAAVIMQWRMPPGPDSRGLAGVDRRALGLPSDHAFIAAYCARRGLPGVEDFGFYLAFAFFRMGAILQGVKKRALDGNASNPERGLALGAHVPNFASNGLWCLRDGWDA